MRCPRNFTPLKLEIIGLSRHGMCVPMPIAKRPKITVDPASPHYSVRREKVHVPSGCESRPATVAPAGSNRSVGGGNEPDEASGGEGRHWRLGEHAGRNVSER